MSQQAIELKVIERYSGLCCTTTNLSCGGAADKVEAQPGERGVDLGSGRGRELFSLVDQVGPQGRLIGVDLSDGMVETARASAREQGHTTVEFRQRHLHDTGLESDSVDFMISNCAINHAPDKDAVYRETFRFLKPGGRFVVSDIYAPSEVPAEFANDPDAVAECWGGAVTREAYLATLVAAGFQALEVLEESEPYAKGEIEVCSFTIRGRKPAIT
ncbi:MAG: methyltransferase domain-containing protein [Gemmatimonadaceae bacterium]